MQRQPKLRFLALEEEDQIKPDTKRLVIKEMARCTFEALSGVEMIKRPMEVYIANHKRPTITRFVALVEQIENELEAEIEAALQRRCSADDLQHS